MAPADASQLTSMRSSPAVATKFAGVAGELDGVVPVTAVVCALQPVAVNLQSPVGQARMRTRYFSPGAMMKPASSGKPAPVYGAT